MTPPDELDLSPTSAGARPSDQALVSDQAASRLDPSGFDHSRELRKWLRAAFKKRGSATAFANTNGLTDEQLLAFLRGSRPPEPRVLDAIGYRKVVSYVACGCWRCTKARTELERGPMMMGQPLAMMRMFLCEYCGNKRCPHAADHHLACTNSNEPGQAGSRYEDALNFRDSDGSGEAGETGTGSTEGDSAGPKDIAQ